ncbi:MAG: hypothetical protein CXT71_08475, partial [Methanobacteriota archaeon]
MGLFDRFKKQAKDVVKEEIVVEEDSIEAELALIERRKLLEAIEKAKTTAPPPPPPGFEDFQEKVEDEWDDFKEQLPPDPFAQPGDKKQRKRAERAASIEPSNLADTESKLKDRDRMQSTTGRKLVAVEPAHFNIDLSDSEVSSGGQIIKNSSVLDEILEDLEFELLSADMGHSATQEVVAALRANLIGARISKKQSLTEVVDLALRKSLLGLLEAGYWDFDKTIQAFVAAGGPV